MEVFTVRSKGAGARLCRAPAHRRENVPPPPRTARGGPVSASHMVPTLVLVRHNHRRKPFTAAGRWLMTGSLTGRVNRGHF